MTSPMSSVVDKYESHRTPITPPDRSNIVDDLQQPISSEPQQPKQLMILRRTPELSRPPSENGQASINFIMEATPSPSDMSPSESGTPSAASSVVGDDDDLIHESSLHANMPVEGFLLAALRNTQDRLLLLKLDKELEAFLNDPKRTKLEFPRMNSYQRMVVHKVAEYFKITHVPDSTKKAVVLFKSEDSAVPSLRFAELIEQEDDEQPQQKVVIMKRQSSKNQRGIPSITSSTVSMDGSSPALAEDRKNMTFEEREAAYKKARAKIFGEGNGSGTEGDDKEGTDKSDFCSVASNPGISANDGDENSMIEASPERPKLMTRTSSGKSKSSTSGNSKQSSSRNSPVSSKTRNSRPSISNTDIIPRPPTQPSQPPPPTFANNFNVRSSGPMPGINPYILTQSYPGQPYYGPSSYDNNNFSAVPQQPQNIALDGVQPPQYFNAGVTDRAGHSVYGPRPIWPNNSQLGPRSYPADMNATNPNNTYFYPHRPQMQSTTQPQGYPISVGRIHQQRDDSTSNAFPPLPTASGLQTGPRSASYTSGAWNLRPNNGPNTFYGVVGGEGLDGQFEQNQQRTAVGYGGARPPNTLDGQNIVWGAMGNNQKQWNGAPGGDIGFTGNGRGGNISENKEGPSRPQQLGPKRHQFQRPFFFPNISQNIGQSQNGWINTSWGGNPSENMPPGGYFMPSPTEFRPQFPLQIPLSAPMSPMVQSNLTSAGLGGLGPRHSGTETLLQQQFSRLHLSEQSPIVSAGTLPNPPVTVYDVERRPPKSTELFDPNSPTSSSGGASASNGSKVYNPTRRKEESGNGGSPGPGSSTLRSVSSLSSSVTPSPPHRTSPNNSSPLRKKEFPQSSGLLFDYTSQNSYEGVKPSEAAAPRAFEHILELYDMVEDDLLIDIAIPNANIKRLGPSAATGNRTVILAVFKKASVARMLLENGDCGRYKLRLWQPLPGGESMSLIERSGEVGDEASP